MKAYIDDIFHSTTLDRNQYVRLAIFYSMFSDDFQNKLSKYLKGGNLLPSPTFNSHEEWFWREQCPSDKEGGKGDNVDTTRTATTENVTPSSQQSESTENRCDPEKTRQSRQVCQRIEFENKGGISFTLD